MNKDTTPIISFVAHSGTGKTTLLEKLVHGLKARGYTVAVIKHDAHRFEIDKPGKDSYRMTAAGADTVAITSDSKMAMICKTEIMTPVEDIITMTPPADIILTEGFRFSAAFPRIEVYRAPYTTELLSRPEELLAVAANIPLTGLTVPCLDMNDEEALTDFVEQYMRDFYNRSK